jgi:hypothetical protein
MQKRLVLGIMLMAAAVGFSAAPAAAQPTSPAGQTVTAAEQNALVPATRLPREGRFVPPHTEGDKEFEGHGPHIVVKAELNVGTKSLEVKLNMVAKETQWDGTTARGTERLDLYDALPGRCIKSVNVGTHDQLEYTDTDHEVDVFPGQTRSFVDVYEVVGDTPGDEAGSETGVAIFTKPFIVTTVSC